MLLAASYLFFATLIFCNKKKQVNKQIKVNAEAYELGQLLGIKQLKIEKIEDNLIYFDSGTYDRNTGLAEYTVKELPFVLGKMTHLHKAKSSEPLYFFNIFFGLSLLFFVISSFWMFMPKTSIFKKRNIFYFRWHYINLNIIIYLV